MTRWAGVVVTVLAAGEFAPAADVELGGPRPVRGSVALAGGSYEVAVSFPPVRAFDPATNAEVNAELAQEAAVRVLAKHLSAAADVEFAAGGGTVVSSGPDGGTYRAVVRWPADRVRVVGAAGRPTAAPASARRVSPAALTGGFFTARRDYLDTLDGLRAAQAAAARAAGSAGPRGAAARAVADLEERGTGALDALARQVRADPRLLDTTERPEVLAAVGAARADLPRALRAALAAAPAEAPRFRDERIDPAYAPYLRAAPLVMELGGAAVADAGNGERVVLGVAKTVLGTGDAEDLVRAERVCLLKAKAAVVADREGTTVTYLKTVADKVVVVSDAAGERVASSSGRVTLTREQAAGVAKGLSVVGRWRSADGRAFYLAVGGRFDAAGRPVRE